MVNPKLYDLVGQCDQFEVRVKDGDTIELLLWIDFYQLNDLVEAMGDYWFDDGGFGDVHLGRGYIVLDLFDVITCESGIMEYKNKFTNWDSLNEWEIQALKDHDAEYM